MKHDLVVIGAGPGGYVAAIRGAQRGLNVVLVEKDSELGGTCLHRGCIPSKAYLAAAERKQHLGHSDEFGLRVGTVAFDYPVLLRNKDKKIGMLAQGIRSLVQANKIRLVTGEAVFESAERIRVGDEVLETRFSIIATGSTPVKPGIFAFDGKSILTTDELFRIGELPKKMVVIGGGVIGVEMACAYQAFGTEVSVVEAMPRILMSESIFATKLLHKIFSKRGICFSLGKKVSSASREQNGCVVTLESGEVLEADLVLVAIGRQPYTRNLNLAAVGVACDEKGFMRVNEHFETSAPGVYAIGDVVGKTGLAHGASHEALKVIDHLTGVLEVPSLDMIPRVVYTIPELAAVGATEEQLIEKGIPYTIGKFPYQANGKALCSGETEGLAQVYVGEEGKLLGGVVVGAHAADLIQELSVCMNHGLTAGQVSHSVHAHPTLGEILSEALEDALGEAIHKVPSRSSVMPPTPGRRYPE